MLNVYKLNTVGEIAPIYSEELKHIQASLMWLKDDDLDLMIFYKTKEGDEGAIYSGNIPGGDFGDLKEFPFIACGDGGVDDDHEDLISYEKMYLNDLTPYSKLYFVITNYAELVLKRKINFKEYQGSLKIHPKYRDVREDRFVLNLNSEEVGDLLVLGEIEVGESILMLKNINQVMTFEEFKKTIPGTDKIKI